jgi:hypothetical protein
MRESRTGDGPLGGTANDEDSGWHPLCLIPPALSNSMSKIRAGMNRGLIWSLRFVGLRG